MEKNYIAPIDRTDQEPPRIEVYREEDMSKIPFFLSLTYTIKGVFCLQKKRSQPPKGVLISHFARIYILFTKQNNYDI